MTPDPQPDRGERRWTIWVWPDGSYSRFNESGHHAVGEPIEVCPVAGLEHLQARVEELEKLAAFWCWTPDEVGRACGECENCERHEKLAQRDKAIAERDELVAAIEAHHESQSWFCNKCGFIGTADEITPPGFHPGPCRYLAATSARDDELYAALNSIQEADSPQEGEGE